MKKLGLAALAVVFGLTVFTACNKQEAPKPVEAPAVTEPQQAPAEEAAPATPGAEVPPPAAPAPESK
ncbi:MAG: hypothetical protein Q8P48_04035 [Deltaproteobacteria bacterium]|nr:hypothetical protein [Deltaproteobacteria bacterium]